MNKQDKGAGKLGIEWCDYTHNPIAGCKHGCAWQMPNGEIANCYAEDVATGIARLAYPSGFEHHYWKSSIVDEPLKVKKPARIFVGSMADVFGHWVPEDQINAVLAMCKRAHWHTFIFLTKNAPRLALFDFPPNVWVGISAPPTFMWGKQLERTQQVRWMTVASAALQASNAAVRWLSAEPLSFNLSPAFDYCRFDWVVIGAASNGKTYYQPAKIDVEMMLIEADSRKVPVFFKGNLKWSPWRDSFPTPKEQQMELF
jgi:protein gp37